MTQIIETQALVIGGGATGVGVLRDLALRGIKALLVEQRDLGHGTTLRNHGLLHSGGRYAVKDREAAIECIQENFILKKTLPGSVEESGGLFVKVPGDPDDYVEQWLEGCKNAGIPTEEVPLSQAFKEEPFLSRDIEAVYRVPDGGLDGFTLVVDVVADAVTHGAKALTYHEVVRFIINQNEVRGVVVRDYYTGEEKEIYADIVINAAGPWGGKIGEMAGVDINLINNRGMLVIFSHRFNKQVINRLRPSSDGDIFVPAHNVSIFGTTGVNVDDPEDTSLDRKELEGMLEHGYPVIPAIYDMRMIRAFSGSRPLYQEKVDPTDVSGRSVSRGMALLDHSKRDGLENFVTISGGKLTTFRLMAEQTVDLVCEKLGISAKCTTHEQVVPHRDAKEFFRDVDMAPVARHKVSQWAGQRAPKIAADLKAGRGNHVICECEQVTWAEVNSVLPESPRFHIGDVRRRTRLGLGPCQGTFCNHRVAALAVENGNATVQEANEALLNAVKERKKGMGVVATGETAKQLEMMEAVYRVSLGLREEEVQYV